MSKRLLFSMMTAILLVASAQGNEYDGEGDDFNGFPMAGWRVDRNAILIQSQDGTEQLTIRFTMDGKQSILTACSREKELYGKQSIRVEGTIDDGRESFSGTLKHVKKTNCWSASLPKKTLTAIKAGRHMQLSLSGIAYYFVSLVGTAEAMDVAWSYVDRRLPAKGGLTHKSYAW